MKRALTIPILFLLAASALAQDRIVVGSKHFNEGYILSEIIAQLLENNGYRIERKFNLGGTAIAFEALRTRAIDIYPEYTGSISAEILQAGTHLPLERIRQELRQQYALEISEPLGFNNTYALVLNETDAARQGIATISDLREHPNLQGAISYEFLQRADGWSNLARAYRLPQRVKGIEHGLAYNALRNHGIDFTDAYSTDGEIKQYNLRVLRDDLKFFPEYAAVSFYQSNLPEPARRLLARLDNRIGEDEMQQMNSSVLFGKSDFATIAHDFLSREGLTSPTTERQSSASQDLFKHILQHLYLTFLSVAIAISIALPLGILLYKHQLFLNPILYLTGIFQTIPSIALLALMIPFLGIGLVPAITALFIYALLPILRNTISGLKGVDPQLKSVATAIGLNANQRLRQIELPLALPSIIAGIRIATVINVGTATLASFIGAGGLGEYIVTGLALNNTNLILKGAIPSALLAIMIELLFELIEKRLTSRHLQ